MQETESKMTELPARRSAAGGQRNQKFRSGGAGRKRGVGKMNSRPALAAARKKFVAKIYT